MKRSKHVKPCEIKINKDRVHDYLQNKPMTEEQRKSWQRKPYQYGGNR